MSEPQETSANIESLAHSGGEPDPIHNREQDRRTGSDVGGPAQTSQAATEEALTGTSSVGAEDQPDDQARNPL